MGKEKKKKSPRFKDRPTGLPSMKELQKEEDEQEITGGPSAAFKAKSSSIQDVINKLNGSTAEQREVGLCTLLSLLSDEKSIKPIISSDIIKIVLCLLQDPAPGVKSAAAGALRNLSALNEKICEILVSEDVMTPLVALFHQYGMNYIPTIKEGKLDSSAETFLQIIHLIWNLCEASNVALGIFNKHSIVNILSRCLDLKVFGNDISIAAVQCLYSVSEDNKDCAEMLNQPAVIQNIQVLLNVCDITSSAIFLKTLAAGIIINLNEAKNSVLSPPLLSKIFEVLIQALSHDTKKILIEIAGIFKSQNHVKGNVEEFSSTYIDLKSAFTDTCMAQEVALEILTNLCGSNDDDEWADIENSDGSDELVDDSAMECDATDCNNDISDLGFISSEIHEMVVKHELASKVLQQSTFPEQDVHQFLLSNSACSVYIQRFSKLSCRFLLCFHNLAMGLKVEELGGTLNVYQTWLQLAEQTLCSSSPLGDSDLMEARSSVLRALVSKIATSNESLCEQLANSNIVLIINESHKVMQDQRLQSISRVNIIRTLGILGSILIGPDGVNVTQAGPIIKDLGKFLLDILNKEQELWVLAETIDTIFDLFSEDYTDSITTQINLVEKLKVSLPLFKSKIKAQRKSLGPHYPVIVTAKDNLPQFIKYKASRIS